MERAERWRREDQAASDREAAEALRKKLQGLVFWRMVRAVLIEGDNNNFGVIALRDRFQVKWVRPEHMHMTLLFAGDVADDRIDDFRRWSDQFALTIGAEIDDAGRRTESGIAAVSLPADSQPVLESATPLERGAGSPACVAIRGNAMGLETALWAEWISADGAAVTGEPVSLGCQPTARHIYCVPPAPRGAAGRLWIHARNAAGETRRHVPGQVRPAPPRHGR